ncbi:hypothetical protein GCM10010082_26230 [Kushneria pakistanensis]|uniref:DUF3549 domain-containing protein n=1 Tax=Kushneria pakistanensis TaxID=1508770 RepID=A0ABQ3FN69_9GAMM|nr:DUF3549 family protein [Kushneria pakistanensis]GHC30784.1 hypothetical protein GCM10010082_26230 [Kushneria pakistanensis]
MLTPTLVDLFTHADITLRIYHLGRRVTPCTIEQFRGFEAQQIAWPQPWQSQAQVALVFTPALEREPIIWCLALPLDEQSMLVPALRDNFLEQLMSTFRREPDGSMALDSAAETLKDVAIALQPNDLTRAMLHARIAHDLELPASHYHETARTYYLGEDSTQDWQQLGLQGIADLVIRRTDEDERCLSRRLSELPDQAFIALCDCLAHAPIQQTSLLDAMTDQHAALEADHPRQQAVMSAILASPLEQAGAWLETLLHRSPDATALAIIAARGWHHLEHERRSIDYLVSISQLAAHDFRVLVRDLTRIPRLRLPMIMAMKQASPGSPLGQQIDAIQREQHG